MGLISWVKNKYFNKGIVGSIEDFRRQTNYNSEISQASTIENLAVNAELQRRIYKTEGKYEKQKAIVRNI